MRWVSLLGFVAVCFAVAGVSTIWTAGEVTGWYRTLVKPAFNPPDWVFGPVWTLLYACMAVAAWRVWLASPSHLRTAGLAVFAIQLTLNFLWSLIFFRLHAIGAALAEIVALWAAIGTTTLIFAAISPLAGWLMAPYWAWVTYASVLNAQIWRLN